MNSITALLTVLFVGLKLADIIAWSWVWVLSPIWISIIIFLVCLVGLSILGVKHGR